MMLTCIKVRWLDCGEAWKTNRQAIRVNTNDNDATVLFAHDFYVKQPKKDAELNW